MTGRNIGGVVLCARRAHHTGKVLGTMIAEDGGVVPPGSGAGAEDEPEDAGRGAVEKDVSVRMHRGYSTYIAFRGLVL